MCSLNLILSFAFIFTRIIFHSLLILIPLIFCVFSVLNWGCSSTRKDWSWIDKRTTKKNNNPRLRSGWVHLSCFFFIERLIFICSTFKSDKTTCVLGKKGIFSRFPAREYNGSSVVNYIKSMYCQEEEKQVSLKINKSHHMQWHKRPTVIPEREFNCNNLENKYLMSHRFSSVLGRNKKLRNKHHTICNEIKHKHEDRHKTCVSFAMASIKFNVSCIYIHMTEKKNMQKCYFGGEKMVTNKA